MPIVYKITNVVNDKCYIGVTKTSLSKRMSSHKSEANAGDNAEIYKAMRLYGIINFISETLEECSEDVMFERGQFYIQKYDSIYPKGYNSTNGGEKGNKQAEISLQKKSKFHKKRWLTVDKKEFSEKMKTMFKDEKHKNAHRLGLIQSWSDERREQFRDLYKKNTNFHNAKGYLKSAEACSKSVILFDTTTNTKTEYKSVSDCARSNNWSVAAVSKQIKKKGFLFGKYLVKFSHDETSFDDLGVIANQKIEDKHTNMSKANKGRIPWNKKT